ncbi:MAG: oxidoreductase [Actinobacteria bacterium]|nr:MAG: oxidoreductase [Actinomycetota bacterium]
MERLTPVEQKAPGRWQVATVAAIKPETPQVKSFRLQVPMWMALADGEVSPYFHDVVVEGDQVEVRGPFTSYFVWRGESPVLLVGGGSGVVPLMCMMRHRRLTMPELPMRLVYSVRKADDVIYADELDGDTVLTFTREPPGDWSGHTGHIDADLIAEAGVDSGIGFVCGSNAFVETASQLLLDAGFDPQQIRTERFGPTG